MTTSEDNKQHNSKGLAIDANAANKCAEEQSSILSLRSESSSAINGHHTPAEQNGKRPSSPLKVVTNISAPSHTSKIASASFQYPSPPANGFGILYPPRIKT